MKNINIAITALENEIIQLDSRKTKCEQTVATLRLLSDGSVAESSENNVSETSNSQIKIQNSTINLEEFKDYPYGKRTADKLKYLDEKYPNGFRMKNRLKLMGELEPNELERMKKYISQELKTLVNTGVYLAIKYNKDNKSQFYFRTEWLNMDGQATTVKPGFELGPEELEILPVHRRKEFKWIFPGEA